MVIDIRTRQQIQPHPGVLLGARNTEFVALPRHLRSKALTVRSLLVRELIAQFHYADLLGGVWGRGGVRRKRAALVTELLEVLQ